MSAPFKVFVWDNVLQDWTYGGMFAVARTVEEARAALKREDGAVPDEDLMREPKVYALTDRPARAVWGGS